MQFLMRFYQKKNRDLVIPWPNVTLKHTGSLNYSNIKTLVWRQRRILSEWISIKILKLFNCMVKEQNLA